jgi:hypothetical protein
MAANLETVQVLLEAGADPHAQQDEAIRAAATERRLPILRHLLLCSNGELQQEARAEVVGFLASQSSEVLTNMLREAQQRRHRSAVRLLREVTGRR